MYVHLLLVGKNMWYVVTQGPLTPKDDDEVVKHPKYWNDGETKKASYDLKARNMLIYALSTKVFYSTLHHTSAKGMWASLQTLYEGTNDVKDSKINMFTQEFELFCMKPE